MNNQRNSRGTNQSRPTRNQDEEQLNRDEQSSNDSTSRDEQQRSGGNPDEKQRG